jgi:mRNA interferase MazF
VIYSRFDVVAVSYPFLEGDQAKRRPGLVVSGANLFQRHGVCWVMMITTAKAGGRDDDIVIANHAAGGLPEPCVIRPSRLTTLPATQIDRRLGSIGARDRTAVQAVLRRWLGA